MKVLHVCSELFPLLKTGGLADVTGALPLALSSLGCDIRVLVPGFPAFLNQAEDKTLLVEIGPKFGAHQIKIYQAKVPNTNINLYIIDAHELYDRANNPYVDSNNNPYLDNHLRFALLGYIAKEIALGLDINWRPQIIHGHDWHSGLAFAYLKAQEIATGQKIAGTIFTIHNLAYQGTFPASVFRDLELPEHFFNINGLEFFGQISFIKSGLFFSDKITTVSQTYSLEIQSPEQGCGLDGLLRNRRYDLHGILNGVDYDVWNPSKDNIISNKYNSNSLAKKAKCKASLQEHVGLEINPNRLLFVVISRLTEQKGINLILQALPEIINRGGQIAILGSGNKELEDAFVVAAKHNPKSIAVQIGYDEEHAHRLIAGGDVILVPSRFEPCGLTQLYGLIYGTLPLVRNVGGLADTVTDSSLENLYEKSATGFVFNNFDADFYTQAIRRAFALYSRKSDWKNVQKCAMSKDFSWQKSAEQYLMLYKQIN